MREVSRKTKDEEQEEENVEEKEYYCREAHGKEMQEYFKTETIEERVIRL